MITNINNKKTRRGKLVKISLNLKKLMRRAMFSAGI